MSKMLDFVIFGPGRSGTSALANALNTHPRIFCGIEHLPFKDDHSQFKVPDAFFQDHLPDVWYRRDGKAMLRQKRDVTLYGNKWPTYYFRLDKLRRELPNLRFVYIYRSPLDFVSSWDRRADDPNDQWHIGLRGIFGALEQVFCLKRLATLPDVMMISYRGLFQDNPSILRDIVDQLGEDASLVEPPALFHPKVPTLSEFYREFFSAFPFDLVDDFFRRYPLAGSASAEFRQTVESQFAKLPNPRTFADFIERHTDASDYARTWFKTCRGRADDRTDPTCDWIINYSARASRWVAARLAATKVAI
jgi:hypothetical protein